MRSFMIFMIFNIFLILVNNCDFVNEVQGDTQKNILLHKQFINEISFKGMVIEKIYCNKCNFNKYQLKIQSNDIDNDKIKIGNLSFPPYYWILKENKILLSVNKELFEETKKNSQLVKLKNSSYISIDNRDFLLLNQKKYLWIP